MGEWWGPKAGKMVVLINKTGKCMDALGQAIGHLGLKPG